MRNYFIFQFIFGYCRYHFSFVYIYCRISDFILIPASQYLSVIVSIAFLVSISNNKCNSSLFSPYFRQGKFIEYVFCGLFENSRLPLIRFFPLLFSGYSRHLGLVLEDLEFSRHIEDDPK